MIAGTFDWIRTHPYLAGGSIALKYGLTAVLLLTEAGKQATARAMEHAPLFLDAAKDTLVELILQGGGP